MKTSKPLALLMALVTACLVLSAGIAAPILCRPFYYAQIEPLGLPEYTGLSPQTIRRAYDEMLDFCVGRTEQFSTGVLQWSQSGKSHFEDVRGLFLLDLKLLALSLVLLALLFFYCRLRRVRPHLFLGRGPGFWGAAGLGGVFLAVGALAALDFQRAFFVFHTLFFPGKDNWMFDWRTDEIILILPEVFFRNCALLILALLTVWCAVLIFADLWAGRRRERISGKSSLPPCQSGLGRPRI